jgi:hypothetical protein
MKKVTILLAALVFSLETSAQVNVAATGEAIVAALNKRDLDGVLATMDVEAVSHIVRDLGLSDADRGRSASFGRRCGPTSRSACAPWRQKGDGKCLRGGYAMPAIRAAALRPG